MVTLRRGGHQIHVLDVDEFIGRFDVIDEASEILIATAHRSLQQALTGIGDRRGFGFIGERRQRDMIPFGFLRDAQCQRREIALLRKRGPNLS